MKTTLKQKHIELLENLDISPSLRAIIYEGIIRNESEFLNELEEKFLEIFKEGLN
jgi:hypothetical protein